MAHRVPFPEMDEASGPLGSLNSHPVPQTTGNCPYCGGGILRKKGCTFDNHHKTDDNNLEDYRDAINAAKRHRHSSNSSAITVIYDPIKDSYPRPTRIESPVSPIRGRFLSQSSSSSRSSSNSSRTSERTASAPPTHRPLPQTPAPTNTSKDPDPLGDFRRLPAVQQIRRLVIEANRDLAEKLRNGIYSGGSSRLKQPTNPNALDMSGLNQFFEGNSNPLVPRNAPSPGLQAQAQQANGVNGMNGQGNGGPGGVNGQQFGPMPAGHQLDLNHLWQQVQELSEVLGRNREQTDYVIRRAAEVRARAQLPGADQVFKELNGQLDESIASPPAPLPEVLQLRRDKEYYQYENDENLKLLHKYEDAFEKVVCQLREYCYNRQMETLAIHRNYNEQLARERETNMNLRNEHAEWQARLLNLSSLLRKAKRELEDDEGDATYYALRAENDFLRKHIGLKTSEEYDAIEAERKKAEEEEEAEKEKAGQAAAAAAEQLRALSLS